MVDSTATETKEAVARLEPERLEAQVIGKRDLSVLMARADAHRDVLRDVAQDCTRLQSLGECDEQIRQYV